MTQYIFKTNEQMDKPQIDKNILYKDKVMVHLWYIKKHHL